MKTQEKLNKENIITIRENIFDINFELRKNINGLPSTNLKKDIEFKLEANLRTISYNEDQNLYNLKVSPIQIVNCINDSNKYCIDNDYLA